MLILRWKSEGHTFFLYILIQLELLWFRLKLYLFHYAKLPSYKWVKSGRLAGPFLTLNLRLGWYLVGQQITLHISILILMILFYLFVSRTEQKLNSWSIQNAGCKGLLKSYIISFWVFWDSPPPYVINYNHLEWPSFFPKLLYFNHLNAHTYLWSAFYENTVKLFCEKHWELKLQQFYLECFFKPNMLL